MTNYEKLKSLVQADDKKKIIHFLCSFSLHVLVLKGQLKVSDFLDEEYDEALLFKDLIKSIEECKEINNTDNTTVN